MLLTSQFAFAQVKKQYQDDTFGQTTVVVKEDQATDLEILNNMDLDDYGMDQVIKITTEDIRRMEAKNKEPKSNAVAVVEKKTPKKKIVLDPKGPERWIPTNKPRKKTVKTTAEIAKVEKQEAKPNLGGAYKKSTSVSKSSKRARVSSSKKTQKYKSGKRKNRRFKKKKRKRTRRKYSCYQF